MAKHAAVNRYLAINGTAISDYCSDIEIQDTTDEIEVTGFNSSGYKEYAPGFSDAQVTATIFADFSGTASPHAILQPLYANKGTFTLTVRDTQAGVGADNPQATMIAKLYSYSPISGAVGNAASFSAAFRNAGTAGLTWGTT